jgi:arylsulfatase A-like enzyme
LPSQTAKDIQFLKPMFVKITRFIFAAFCLCNTLFAEGMRSNAPSGDRPNIVWIVSEDNSVHYLRHYTEGGAAMPNVERLAEKGITFTQAFSNAPVCSVARSALISGCYGPRTFTQFHRASAKVPLPDGLHMLPWYLRHAGYYTTNKSKEDYNFIKGEGVWNESSIEATYRNRAPGQPFFHVRNFGTTHEGKLHFSKEQMEKRVPITDPDSVPLFPVHPDTPIFRYTNAIYRDLQTKVDEEIGELLNQLSADGLMEETIIFYYGDHGGVLPGSKGYLYETGLHVPLVVYVPEKWSHLLPREQSGGPPMALGERWERPVQFIDFAPTVLHLAGLEIPEAMDGSPFLGEGITIENPEKETAVFSYADRFDEKYDFVRALRKGRYKYIRSYQPFNIDGLHNYYRYRNLAYLEWRELFREGALNAAQSRFFRPRPAEALYDVVLDPHETKDLSGDSDHAAILEEMRGLLKAKVTDMPDLSFIPEPILFSEAVANPVAYGQAQAGRIAELVEVADLALVSFPEALSGIETALQSTDPLKRYWGWIVCSVFAAEAVSLREAAHAAAREDPDNLVRLRAAEFLGLSGIEEAGPLLLECLGQSQTEIEALLVLNTMALLYDRGLLGPIDPGGVSLPDEWLSKRDSNVAERMKYLSSASRG